MSLLWPTVAQTVQLGERPPPLLAVGLLCEKAYRGLAGAPDDQILCRQALRAKHYYDDPTRLGPAPRCGQAKTALRLRRPDQPAWWGDPVTGWADFDFHWDGGWQPRDGGVHPVPSPRGISPNRGPAIGNTLVVIIGLALAGVQEVLIGGKVADEMRVISDQEVRCYSHRGSPGLADVVLLAFGGVGSLYSAFTYEPFTAPPVLPPPPTVTGLQPAEGPEAGGTQVILDGTGFLGAIDVTFAGVSATDLRVPTDGNILCRTPGGPPGAVDVVVVHPHTSGTLVDGFTYT